MSTLFSCTDCDYNTRRKSDLNRHMKRHANIPLTVNLLPKVIHPNPNIENGFNTQELHEIEEFMKESDQITWGVTEMTQIYRLETVLAPDTQPDSQSETYPHSDFEHMPIPETQQDTHPDPNIENSPIIFHD